MPIELTNPLSDRERMEQEFKKTCLEVFKIVSGKQEVKLNFDPNHPLNQKYDEVKGLEKAIKSNDDLLRSLDRQLNITHADGRASSCAHREREKAKAQLEKANHDFEVLKQDELSKENGLQIQTLEIRSKDDLVYVDIALAAARCGIRADKTGTYQVINKSSDKSKNKFIGGYGKPKNVTYRFDYVLIGLKDDIDRFKKEVIKK